ncbi:regulator of G-protein signaling [Acrasis kona]|uniref:Regulator of G-protein signaling n=1 Tax=Acrasis kona TaxID=1008807 RepID=A0AAW2YLG9_9EUKA
MREPIPLKKGFLDSIRTNKGVTIGDINKSHKVLILFLRQSQCCFCREAIRAISINYMTLLQFNTIPVLVHMETPPVFAEALKEIAEGDAVTENLITAYDDENVISNEFSIQRSLGDFLKHFFPTLKAYLNSEETASVVPRENVDLFRVPSFFIIDNDAIVNEFRNVHMGSRPDYIRVLVDPDYEGEMEVVPIMPEKVCEGVYCPLELKNKKPNLVDIIKNEEKVKNTFSCVPKIEPSVDVDVSQVAEELDMTTVLSNHKYIKYFNVHCAKEHASENVSFWKDVHYNFKKEQNEDKRGKISEKIFDTYLNPASLLEINVTDKLKKSTRKELEECGPKLELFDSLVRDIENQLLCNLFMRFKETPLFTEMILKVGVIKNTN